MDSASFRILEFHLVKDILGQHCASNLGKDLVDKLTPSSDIAKVGISLLETQEATLLVGRGTRIDGLHDVRDALSQADSGAVLSPSDLLCIASVLRGASKFKRLMGSRRAEVPLLASYALSIVDLPDLVDVIESSLDGDRVRDEADPELRKVRRGIVQTESKIQGRLSSIMAAVSLRDAIQDGFVAMRHGRFCIPVRASQRHRIDGAVVAASSTGQTVFIEPSAIRSLVDELVTLRAREEDIVHRVLWQLTGDVVTSMTNIKVTLEAMAVMDLAFAKGKLSLGMGGVMPQIHDGQDLEIDGGRHPLLEGDVVPLDLALSPPKRTLVVTGPNTGGKTVLLKTIGLFALMAQSGLHVPARSAKLPVFSEVLADIGDHQSIKESLSTFSSHMENIAHILELAGSGSLVLLDEIGTGTDPREGAALATAILGSLFESGSITMATTHYGDVKTYCDRHPGFVNGCMEFDDDTLEPLFRLSIGKAGESQGITVARRLGIPHEVIEAAKRYLDGILTEVKDAYIEIERKSSPAPIFGEPLPGAEFRVGDSVFVTFMDYHGVVAREVDTKGDLVVLVKGEKVVANWKRLRALVKREDLYPDYENYDMDIVLIGKDERRAKKAMAKGKTGITRKVEEDPR